jgi:hypothetical protein
MTDLWDDDAQFPALRRSALSLRGSDANSFPIASVSGAHSGRSLWDLARLPTS